VTEVRKPSETEPFAGLAFKTIFDKHGDLTFIRVYSGVLRSGDRLANPRRDKREKSGQLYLMHANEREKIDLASPGDIVAVAGLKHTYTGDTLCDEDNPIILEAMKFPDTVISMAIEPKSNADKDKLAQALSKLSKEDPTFTHNFDDETGQLIIAGMGELHLEVIKNRMVRDHGVDANVGEPRELPRRSHATPKRKASLSSSPADAVSTPWCACASSRSRASTRTRSSSRAKLWAARFPRNSSSRPSRACAARRRTASWVRAIR
jgi:translation elongation factor EF-G